MKRQLIKNLAAAGLLLAAFSTGATAAGAAQLATEHSCCLAAEWVLDEPVVAAQRDGEFCCIALEWTAPAVAGPQPATELAAQSDHVSCCLAAEWLAL